MYCPFFPFCANQETGISGTFWAGGIELAGSDDAVDDDDNEGHSAFFEGLKLSNKSDDGFGNGEVSSITAWRQTRRRRIRMIRRDIRCKKQRMKIKIWMSFFFLFLKIGKKGESRFDSPHKQTTITIVWGGSQSYNKKNVTISFLSSCWVAFGRPFYLWVVLLGVHRHWRVPPVSGGHPTRLLHTSGGWVYCLASEAPPKRGMPTGSKVFLVLPDACGLRPCVWTHLKNGRVPYSCVGGTYDK